MPRTHVGKTVKYDKEYVLSALKDIENGKSIREASIQYGLPYHALCRWIRKPSTRIGSNGRHPAFPQDEEHSIVDALKFLHDCGFPCYISDVVNIAQDYMELNGRSSPYTIGLQWARAFQKRWNNHLPKFPSLVQKMLPQVREAPLPENVATRFFLTYINFLDKNGLSNHPNRIFSLAEAGLSTDVGASEVFFSKQSKNLRETSPVAGKAVYSVLFCISAGGSYMPPFTIYKSARLNHSWTKCGPPGALYGCSVSGWMDEKVLESWMEHFVSYTKNTEKPIVLIFDGHIYRLTYKIIKTALDNQVILCCLPSNSSHVLQPLDVGVLPPAEKSWRQILEQWYQETGTSDISEAIFPEVLKRLFESLRTDHVVNGFKSAGLFPPNIKEVQHKIVRALNKSYVSSTSPNTNVSVKCEPDVSSNSLETDTLLEYILPTIGTDVSVKRESDVSSNSSETETLLEYTPMVDTDVSVKCESDMSSNSCKTNTLLEYTPATSDAYSELPSCSSKHGKAIQNPTNLFSSPLNYISDILTSENSCTIKK